MEDNISSNQLSLVWLLHCSELQLAWRANPRACNIELPMPKHLAPQPDPNFLHCLTLRLVDSYCKCWPDRKLPSLPLEGIFSGLGDEGYAGNQNHAVGSHNLTLQQLVVYGSQEG